MPPDKRRRCTADDAVRAQCGAQTGGERGSCPICFEAFERAGERTESVSFQCSHTICVACDHALFVRGDDRCPLCRSGRNGASLRRHATTPRRRPSVSATIFFANVPVDYLSDEAQEGGAQDEGEEEQEGGEGDDSSGVVVDAAYVLNRTLGARAASRRQSRRRVAPAVARDDVNAHALAAVQSFLSDSSNQQLMQALVDVPGSTLTIFRSMANPSDGGGGGGDGGRGAVGSG